MASSYFFTFLFLPRQILLSSLFGSIIIIIIGVIFGIVYDRKRRFEYNFSFEITLILLSLVTGIFGAKWGHGQSFALSLWIQTYMYFYFFYFFLHSIRIRPDELIRLLVIMSILYIAVWYIQYLMFPKMIVNSRMDVERGTIRLFIPGSAIALLVYFYFLDLFLRTNKTKFIIFCLFILLIPILQGTRTSMSSLIFVTLVFVLFSKQVKTKLRNIILMLVGALLIFFIFQDIFINLINLSEKQSAQEGDDIRVRSAKFYLTEFYPNKINYFLGNGIGHMMSPYGMKLAFYKFNYGFFQSDLGLIGAYVKFGVLFVVGAFLIILKIFRTNVKKEHYFIKYWAVFLAIQYIIGYPFISPDSIIAIISAIYIIDVSSYELKLGKES